MDIDLELDGWRHEWQADVATPTDLADRVARETRRMHQFVLTGIAITIVFGGGSIAWAAISGRSELLVLVVGTWAFLAIAWAMSWLLRRGASTPLTTTTSAFLDLSILRCRRRREATFAQAVLYVAVLSFNLWWIHANSLPHAGMDTWTFLTSRGVLWVWPVTALLAVMAARQHRRLRRELQALTALQQAFQDGDDSAKELNSWHLRTSRGLRSKSRRPTGRRYGRD